MKPILLRCPACRSLVSFQKACRRIYRDQETLVCRPCGSNLPKPDRLTEVIRARVSPEDKRELEKILGKPITSKKVRDTLFLGALTIRDEKRKP